MQSPLSPVTAAEYVHGSRISKTHLAVAEGRTKTVNGGFTGL